jgi:predicted HicB family RNase H-like nuclease
MDKEEKYQVSLRLNESMHKKIKIEAAEKNTSMQSIIEGLIVKHLKREKK